MPMRRIFLLLICLTTTGCAGFNHSGINVENAAPPPPEGKRLGELVTSAFAQAKLTGTPEVSAVRPTHDSEWGDWMFCIKGASAQPSPKYAVLIGHDAILEVRTSVLIDGCDDDETYHPLPPDGAHGKAPHK